MGKKATLAIQILADAAQARKGFDEAASGLDKIEQRAEKGRLAMSAASAGVVALGKQAFDAASELQQSTGAVEAVFKTQADQIYQLADAASQAVGLSKNEYQELATVMGSQLKNMGVAQDEVTGKTADLVSLGADLAATFGGSTADAVGALSSLMRGEADPIERYGVSIKKADINARLAAKGLTGLEGEAAKAAETQAMMELLTEQTSDALGAFAREADTAAGQQQRATAEWTDAKAALGEALLPVITEAAKALGDIAKEVGAHPGLFRAAAGAIVGVTGAMYGISGAIKVYKTAGAAVAGVRGAVTALGAAHDRAAGKAVAHAAKSVAGAAKATGAWVAAAARGTGAAIAGSVKVMAQLTKEAAVWTAHKARVVAATVASRSYAAAQALMNAVMNANPLGVIVTALAAVAGGLIYAYKHSETFRNAISWLGDKAGDVFGWVVHKVADVVEWLITAWQWVRKVIDAFSSMSAGDVWHAVTSMFSATSAPTLNAVPNDGAILYAAAAPDLTAAFTPPRYLPAPRTVRGGGGGPTINITVNGALDPYSVAREIEGVLERYRHTEAW